MKALLLIGLQIDLLPHGPAEVPGSQSLAPVVNRLTEAFEPVVAANFHLPANHVMFAGNHSWRYPGQVIEIEGSPTLLHTIFCVQHSFGAAFIPDLDTRKIVFTAEMGTDPTTPARSAFFDHQQKRHTGLGDFLHSKNATEIYLAGMPLENEVLLTAMDSIDLGFRPILIGDACLARSREAGISALEQLQSRQVEIVQSSQIF